MVYEKQCFADLYKSNYVIIAHSTKIKFDTREGNVQEALLLEADTKLLWELYVWEKLITSQVLGNSFKWICLPDQVDKYKVTNI